MGRLAVAAAVTALVLTSAGVTRAVKEHDKGFPVPNAVISGGAECRIGGSGAFTIPDDKCSPGALRAGFVPTRANVCGPDAGRRPSTAVKATVLRRYGMDPANFQGEVDHRIMRAMGGADTPENLWPQIGPEYANGQPKLNKKDALERELLHRVCRTKTMEPAEAIAIFKGDWRPAYKKYVKDA